jgi:hypothetical protein
METRRKLTSLHSVVLYLTVNKPIVDHRLLRVSAVD